MTIEEFRKDNRLVGDWASMLREHELLRLILFDVMDNAHPAKFTLQEDNNGDVSPTMAAIELGKTRGYSLYGDRLRLLSTPIRQAAHLPPPTYEKEKEPHQTANAS